MRTWIVFAVVGLSSCREPVPTAPSPARPSPPASASATVAEPRTAKETKAWLCECHRRSGMLGDCEEMGFDDPDADCLRTYADCGRALACLRGEPGVGPKCLPGYRNAGAISRCARICREGSECGPEEECTSQWGAPSVCWFK